MPSYQAAQNRFDGVGAQVLGLSVDSGPCLTAWAESLGGITYPLLSDFYPHGWVAQTYGVLRAEGYSERALFIVDRQGVVRYVDVHDIDSQPDNDVLFAELEKLAPKVTGVFSTPKPEEAPAEAEDTPVDPGRVFVFCTPWCPDCRRARDFLKNLQVDFTEVDITRDRAAARRVRGWANGNETTPTFSIYGQVQVGYDKVRLARALGVDETNIPK